MSLRRLVLLKLACCGGPLLLLLVPSSVRAAAATALAGWAWPLTVAALVAAALAAGAVLRRGRRRVSCRRTEGTAMSAPGAEPGRSEVA